MIVECLEAGNRVLERLECADRFQIADVLAEKDLCPGRECNGVFEMCADSQYTRRHVADIHRQRGIPACTSQYLRPTSHDTGHRIVHWPHDRPVVDEKHIGDPVEPVQRLVFIDANWLVR